MPPAQAKPRKKFLSGYDLDEDYLLTPDIARGRPGILRGRDPEGRSVLVKDWPLERAAGFDLEQIWRSEVRQLQRLAAVPRADELFVPLLASGEDKDGFYLVLDPGQGSLLETFRRARNKPAVLAQPTAPRNRRRLWANVLRVAEALELLHSQGIIHRNVDPWSIVTAFGEQPDFRLTGFEWSMRIATVDGATSGQGRAAGREPAASFGRDWINLGLVVSELVGAPLERVTELRFVPSEIAEHLSANEGQVLRSMLQLQTAERLDGEALCRRIRDVEVAVTAQAAGKEARLELGIGLSGRSRVSEAIRRASDNEIEIADIGQQLAFVSNDLADAPYFVRIKDRDRPDTPYYALLGTHLTYVLTAYRQPGSTEEIDWEFASCERADQGRPLPSAILGTARIDPASLGLTLLTEATRSFPRKRGRVERWDDYVRETEPKEVRKSELDRKHQAFSLLLVLEMAYAAADVFPIEVVPTRSEPSGDAYQLRVASRYDADRAALSTALGLEAPAVRLTRLLESEDIANEGAWLLSETGFLGDRGDDTEWRFLKQEESFTREVLLFEGQAPAHVTGAGFLMPPGIGGQVAQFKRRRKALRTLSEHTELLRMFVDPRLRIEDSHDPINEKSDRFLELDKSKQDALREILSTIPFFLLQGPPGVGKTFLVGDIVRRRFEDDATTRMLLSAQSHAAIDHLMKEVQSVFTEEAAPVMVRARPADDDPADTDLELDRQADRLLQDLAGSELVDAATPALRDKIRTLARARQEPKRGRRTSGGMAAEGRAFEGMILRAANLVFATTNSGAVERLIEERSLFDWTIVEEAGKATGGELLSPLLLSHRRLMIGDHRQLPPYGADKLTRLLELPDKVKAAVTAAQDLISRHLKDPGIDELFDDVEAELEDFGRLCSETLLVLTLFETLVEAELQRQSRRAAARPIARRLNKQHRMHPAIARIVSDCFYGGTLITAEKKERECKEQLPPVRSHDAARLPDAPIVFIDMPYGRAQHGYRGGDRSPPWSNPDEVSAVVDALALLRSAPRDGGSPSLAVLSPYREQVRRLREGISAQLSGSLGHLNAFTPAVGDGEFWGTVDSFQGDQADVVIVSMVRNNAHASPAKALGFLRDDRRMNVLLSRAKWRLLVVGSLEFYRRVVEFSAAIPDAEIGFLKRFLASLRSAEAAGDAAIVPWARLLGRTQ